MCYGDLWYTTDFQGDPAPSESQHTLSSASRVGRRKEGTAVGAASPYGYEYVSNTSRIHRSCDSSNSSHASLVEVRQSQFQIRSIPQAANDREGHNCQEAQSARKRVTETRKKKYMSGVIGRESSNG